MFSETSPLSSPALYPPPVAIALTAKYCGIPRLRGSFLKSVHLPVAIPRERNADLRTYFILDSTCLDSVEVGQRQPKIPGPGNSQL